MKLSGLLTFLVAAFAMQSCTDTRRADALLSRADSLLEADADSARQLLVKDSAIICSSGRAARMWYALSRTEADDKRYVAHTSDSAISAAAEYYSDDGTPLQRIRAYYLLGRVNYDLRLYGRALSAFKEALSVKADEDSVINRYKARAATWAGHVYEEKGLHNDALRYNKKSYTYSVKLRELEPEVYLFRNIGRSYSYLKKNKIAIPYYLRAADTAKSLHDGYLYNMVMEELASIYMEEGLFEKAREALSAPFYSKEAQDLSSHYFIWATYFERTGRLDSAIIYNKKGLLYGRMEDYAAVHLNLAQIYRRMGKLREATENYEIYSRSIDSIAVQRAVENSEFIEYVEKNINAEKQNNDLEKAKNNLISLVLAIVMIVSVLAVISVRFYYKKRTLYELQRERAKRYWEKMHEQDVSNIEKNVKLINSLEQKLYSSNETITDLQRKLLKAEIEVLDVKNNQILSAQKQRDALVSEFENSDIYHKFHSIIMEPTNEDFNILENTLNATYDRFVFRLKELYPMIRYDELRICCLTKTGLASKEICNVLGYKANKVSMTKVRLYGKIFNEKCTVETFDKFIREF